MSHLISQRYLEPYGAQSAVPTPNQTIILSDISKAEGAGPLRMPGDRGKLPIPGTEAQKVVDIVVEEVTNESILTPPEWRDK